MANLSVRKSVQRRLLDLLSDRNALVKLVMCCLVLAVAALQFGQAWLQWSSDKYEALFNSFSDNLASRSLQSSLCQYVPLDVGEC